MSQSTLAEDESMWQKRFQAAKRVQRPQSALPALLARQRQQSKLTRVHAYHALGKDTCSVCHHHSNTLGVYVYVY